MQVNNDWTVFHARGGDDQEFLLLRMLVEGEVVTLHILLLNEEQRSFATALNTCFRGGTPPTEPIAFHRSHGLLAE